jgi:VTC domain
VSTLAVSLESLPSVSLEELDDRASLLKRTDTKYVLDSDTYASLVGELARDHEALEIDGRREFAYESTYFDTPELRCFHDHIDGRIPRFKARTRLYRDTRHCTFEVKLKLGDGKTDKRQIDQPPDAADRIDAEAMRCLEGALERIGYAKPERPLDPSLRTRFTRVTLAPRHGRERTTCDIAVELERPGGARARVRDGLIVVETKTERGDGPADRILRRLGVEPLSFSKYRTGIALLADAESDPEAVRRGERLFEVGWR